MTCRKNSESDGATFLPETKNPWQPDKEIELVRKTQVKTGFSKNVRNL